MISRLIARLTEPLAELVRWGEPYDLEDDADPFLDRTPAGLLLGPTSRGAS